MLIVGIIIYFIQFETPCDEEHHFSSARKMHRLGEYRQIGAGFAEPHWPAQPAMIGYTLGCCPSPIIGKAVSRDSLVGQLQTVFMSVRHFGIFGIRRAAYSI